MIVVDASVLVDLLVDAGTGPEVRKRLLAPEVTLHAPHIVDVEVAHALRRRVLGDRLDKDRGRLALRDLAIVPLHRYRHDLLLGRIWDLRHNLTAYDACYVALAEVLDAPLLTRDAGLARSTGHDAVTELVEAA